MKQILLMVAGAVGLYLTAKRFNINSVEDVKQLVNRLLGDLNLKELIKDNVEKVKSLGGIKEEEMATA